MIKGPIILINGNENETQVIFEEFIYEPPFELHGYKNPNKFSVSFICGIPKLKKKSKILDSFLFSSIRDIFLILVW